MPRMALALVARAAVFVAALLLVGCTHAPWHPHRGWKAYKTANVTVYADTVGEPSLTLQYMEEAYQAFEGTFFTGFDIPPVEVIEMREASDSPFLNSAGEKKFNVAMLKLARPDGSARPLLMVSGQSERLNQAHVLAHHFIEQAVPKAPVWFHEGLAQYLSVWGGLARRPDVVCYGQLRPGRMRLLLEPLGTIFNTSWRNYNDVHPEAVLLTAWGLMDYLLHARRPAPITEFRFLIKELRSGKNAWDALKSAYGGPATEALMKNLETDMRAHLHRTEEVNICPLPHPALPARRRREVPVVSDVPEETMRALFTAIEALSPREGYADFYP